MTADVVICFYKAIPLWPYVAWGLTRNQDHISNVIISNDEEWLESDKQAIESINRQAKLTTPIVFVGHPRNGMRQAQCINDGVKAATSDYIIQIDDDIVLPAGAIEKLLQVADEGILLTGHIDDIARGGFPVDLLGCPHILKEDKRVVSDAHVANLWAAVRDNFLCYRRSDYLAMGGHDEGYHDGQEVGYGWVDYDFAIRWFQHFGPDSLEMTEARAFHMSGLKPGHQYSEINIARFQSRLDRYHAWLREQHLL